MPVYFWHPKYLKSLSSYEKERIQRCNEKLKKLYFSIFPTNKVQRNHFKAMCQALSFPERILINLTCCFSKNLSGLENILNMLSFLEGYLILQCVAIELIESFIQSK